MRFKVITIEREFASGGREVGEKVAEKLKIPCYGHEILERAAEKLNISPERLSEMEEKMTGSLLYSIAALAALSTGQSTELLTLEQKLANAEAEVIKNISSLPCVIIGRAAAALLKDKENTLKVFIHADYNTRKHRASNIYGIDPKQTESVLQRFDKRRANFFKIATNTDWKDSDIYHLSLNSSKLGIDAVVDIIYAATVKRIE